MKLSFLQDENAVEIIDGITYEFPYTMHERDLSDFIVPWHWHEELEFNYVYKGSILIETLNRSYTLHQGDAYFINTNVMDTKRKANGASEAVEHAHLFHPVLLSGHFRSLFETKYLNPILKNQSLEVVVIRENTKSGREFLKLLRALTRLQEKPGQEFHIRNLLSQAWLTLMDEIQSQQAEISPGSSFVQERMKSILSYLHENYGEKITISDLAMHIGTSEKECIRSFKSVFHRTPIDYLIEYRIEQAKRLLKETDQDITSIAFATGFNSSAYFSKIFRAYTQLTPTDYRKHSESFRQSNK